ncbi:tail fiber assembly protein [Dryocola sp. BD626]|uniref:tail fiber assembly protein n=1 Tax=Dryocola sp. BD626 TaxID=3133273 RepID=UPI003F505F72
MIQFKNVKISRQVYVDGVPLPVCYFEDDLGRDWYTLRDKIWTGETAFIAVSPEGFITTGARDPNFMTLSEGVSIYEIPAADYRDDIGARTYLYQKEKIVEYAQPESELAGAQKNALLEWATAAIGPLQDAVDLGIATEEEAAQLLEWRKYRVMLKRLDISDARNIKWPEKPAS